MNPNAVRDFDHATRIESTNSIRSHSPFWNCTLSSTTSSDFIPMIAPVMAAIARQGRRGIIILYIVVYLLFGGGGNLHRLETSSGKIVFQTSMRNDGAMSGDDKREVNVGKNSWTNCLLMAGYNEAW